MKLIDPSTYSRSMRWNYIYCIYIYINHLHWLLVEEMLLIYQWQSASPRCATCYPGDGRYWTCGGHDGWQWMDALRGASGLDPPRNVKFQLEVPKWLKIQVIPTKTTGWWFQDFFIFTTTWGNDPIWRIFFKWVGSTTNESRWSQRKLRWHFVKSTILKNVPLWNLNTDSKKWWAWKRWILLNIWPCLVSMFRFLGCMSYWKMSEHEGFSICKMYQVELINPRHASVLTIGPVDKWS